VWLTWGISEAELETIPPTAWRIFGFEVASKDLELEEGQGATVAATRERPSSGGGLGSSLGTH
jgi:hypothetical protein